MNDSRKQQIIVESYGNIQISLLETYKQFLESNLDKNETFIQNRIDGKIDNDGNEQKLSDEEIKKTRRSRCLIFGLEYIDHKSQGLTESKRFDLLTRISESRTEHILVELKSPNGKVFDISEKNNINSGKTTEYSLSSDLARAIPQISNYKNKIESYPPNSEDLQRIGLVTPKIVKSIIVIGIRLENNPVWEDNFLSLRKNFTSGLEIFTYTDIIEKLETTIKNLKENL